MAQDAQIPMECIVVDDRGTDNSMAVVNRLVDAYQGPIEFRIVTREKNGGLSAARNSGIDVARGEYLYFVDSDDTITPDAIRLLWQQVEAHPGVDMVVGAAKCFPTECYLKDYIALRTFTHPEFTHDADLLNSIFLKVPVVAWNKLIRSEFLRSNALMFKIGIIHEDLHHHLRTSMHIESIAFSNVVTYNYRMRKGSITMTSSDVDRRHRVLHIINDLIETGYISHQIICWILNTLTDYGLEIQLDAKFESVKQSYYKTLKSIIEHLSLKHSLPFRYLQLKRPWMRVAILNKIAAISFKDIA
jgi:glycosyltransferase involved in cell wall biosynthesis